MCPQIRLSKSLPFLGNEDCLFLNVYKPANATNTTGLPVLFWIYGGGFMLGDGYEFGLYDAQLLASTHNVVVVTHNYRLGGLGFFALKELQNEDPNRSTGNYGVQDQREALRWTHANIREFGGSPDRITIFGESAGGFSVMWHLVSKESQGLYSAAIMESGTSDLSWFFPNLDNATAYYEYIAAEFGCNDSTTKIDCLRKLPAKDFVVAFSQWASDSAARKLPGPLPSDIPDFGSPLFPVMPNGPAVDGSPMGLTGVPLDLVRAGGSANVPLMLGSNRDGGDFLLEQLLRYTVPGGKFPADKTTFNKTVRWILDNPELEAELASLYPESEFANATKNKPFDERISYAIRDCVFQCPDRRLAQAWSSAQKDTFLYTFSFDLGKDDKLIGGGDFHASELPFVFKTYLPELGLLLGVKEPQLISDIMSCRWARFAYCHDPNGCEDTFVPGCDGGIPGAPRWPKFDEEGSEGMFYSLKKKLEAVALRSDNLYPDNEYASDAKCEFWDRAPLPWHSLRQKA